MLQGIDGDDVVVQLPEDIKILDVWRWVLQLSCTLNKTVSLAELSDADV